MNKYFDLVEYKKIETFVDKKKFHKAYELLKIYLAKYPEDEKALTTYISLLVRYGKYEEATQLFDSMKSIEEIHPGRVNQLLNEYFKYFVQSGQYQEGYDFLLKHETYLLENDYPYLAGVKLFLRSRLGLLTEKDEKVYGSSYLFSQVMHYDEEAAKEHVAQHAYDLNEVSYFYQNVPMDELYNKTKEAIPHAKILHNHTISSMILFKSNHEGIGVDRNKTVSSYIAEVLADTNQIITIYPCEIVEWDDCNLIDLTINEEPSKQETRVSQIDKFNARYAKVLSKKR